MADEHGWATGPAFCHGHAWGRRVAELLGDPPEEWPRWPDTEKMRAVAARQVRDVAPSAPPEARARIVAACVEGAVAAYEEARRWRRQEIETLKSLGRYRRRLARVRIEPVVAKPRG